MGYGYSRSVPVDFYNLETGDIDWKGFQEDLRGKLQIDCKGFENGLSTVSLAIEYYKNDNLESCLSMAEQLQLARFILLKRGIILRNASKRWHIVNNAEEASRFLNDRAVRLFRAYAKTIAISEIAIISYPELAESPFIKSLNAMSLMFKKLENNSIENTEELEE